MIPRSCLVVENYRCSESIYLLKLKLLDNQDFDPKPLQFVMLWLPGIKEIPLSIADYNGSQILFIYRIRGRGTKALSEYKHGFVGIRGPLGKPFDISKYRSVLVVAGGVGIAPIPFLVRKFNGVEIDIVWGVKRSSELCRDIVEYIRSIRSDIRIYLASEDGEIGFRGTVLDLAKELVLKKQYDVVFAVGPNEMLKRFCMDFEFNGLKFVAPETIVKCGMGMCGSCILSPTHYLLCKDGPVFLCNDVLEYLVRID